MFEEVFWVEDWFFSAAHVKIFFVELDSVISGQKSSESKVVLDSRGFPVSRVGFREEVHVLW